MKLKAFLDTNILLDILQEGRPSAEFSQIILQTVFNYQIEAVITSQSVLDASYVALKAGKDPDSFFNTVQRWHNFINTDQIDTFDLTWAIRNFSGDFEDDAQVSRALDTRCDVFVTGDRKLLNHYKGAFEHLQFMTPEEFVAKMRG